MNKVVGIGIDLTQHVPLVSVCHCPSATHISGCLDPAVLARHWPPKVELCGAFSPRPPVALLPLTRGEPMIVGEAAAKHRRSAGLLWPPEAQVPFSEDAQCGVGRIPLVAAWSAILPRNKDDSSMSRRDDHEFSWWPDGDKPYSARAGEILARSIKAFLTTAHAPFDKCLTAIVVPDALDEAGQQILLDSLIHVGIPSNNVHLLPRPIAVALHWCHTSDSRTAGRTVAGKGDEGTETGRVRVLTMALDPWEAQSLEIRARLQYDREWLVPVRDRTRLSGALPELQLHGFSVAFALAKAQPDTSPLSWWSRLFASDWLSQRIIDTRIPTRAESDVLRAVLSSTPAASLRRELDGLSSLKQSLWSRFFQADIQLHSLVGQRWQQQERLLGISYQPTLVTLADGAFAHLKWENASLMANHLAGAEAITMSNGYGAAVRGAALAAAAISHGLPSYRETLLPLDLFVYGRDEYDDPAPQWRPLVDAQTIEAGRLWSTPDSVNGLQIKLGQDKLWLPLRRSIQGTNMFREVATELMQPTKRDEPVRIDVEVRPGQGFARVRIDSIRPDVFSTRLDWRTMKECAEPQPPPLAYPPGVSRIEPDRLMFANAEPALSAALKALENDSRTANDRLREAIKLLNKWPLAHNVERRRGHQKAKDFMLHYGAIGSEGRLEVLPAPGLARGLRNLIGEQFDILVRRGKGRSPLANTLLRAGGWYYLAMPEECYGFLRSQLRAATKSNVLILSLVDLHAIGLGFSAPEDLRAFYPLVVDALRHQNARPNNWLRSVRNICRFRNHALHPDIISNQVLTQLIEQLFAVMRHQADTGNFARIFSNCVESIPFLLKRRRYDPDFLAPDSMVARRLIRFLEDIERDHRHSLPNRLQQIPIVTLKFLKQQATATDLEQLLGIDDEGGEDDE